MKSLLTKTPIVGAFYEIFSSPAEVKKDEFFSEKPFIEINHNFVNSFKNALSSGSALTAA